MTLKNPNGRVGDEEGPGGREVRGRREKEGHMKDVCTPSYRNGELGSYVLSVYLCF